jgi:hypothetical protein
MLSLFHQALHGCDQFRQVMALPRRIRPRDSSHRLQNATIGSLFGEPQCSMIFSRWPIVARSPGSIIERVGSRSLVTRQLLAFRRREELRKSGPGSSASSPSQCGLRPRPDDVWTSRWALGGALRVRIPARAPQPTLVAACPDGVPKRGPVPFDADLRRRLTNGQVFRYLGPWCGARRGRG